MSVSDPSGRPLGGLFGTAKFHQARSEVWKVKPEACDLLWTTECEWTWHVSLQDGCLEVILTKCCIIQQGFTEHLFRAYSVLGRPWEHSLPLPSRTSQPSEGADMEAVVIKGGQAGLMLWPRQDGSAKRMVTSASE